MVGNYRLISATGSERVYLVRNPCGANATYEACDMVCFRSGKRVWSEGVRRDRTHMVEPLRSAVEHVLALQE